MVVSKFSLNFESLTRQKNSFMGEMNVVLPKSQEEVQDFVRRLLNDTRALEKMLYDDLFENEIMHIGAEQEMNLIDAHLKPANLNMDVLAAIDDEMFTTELARFNLECNVDPRIFEGSCISDMEKDIIRLLKKAKKVAKKFECELILTGILPTIRKSDLSFDSLTPVPRYRALMDAILHLRGEASMSLNISGTDELRTIHDSPMLEACNTGFQVHLQVRPDDFVSKYNIAQAICGPALATAINSPLLFGKRLWQETRIALFQQSVDTRATKEHLRDRSPRVMFGNRWVKNSIMDIYKEDIMRFRVLLSNVSKEDSLKILAEGKIPALSALSVHNGTIYRWNRPCYGNTGEKPHLRIENRVLPAGPTVADEMANTALWLGLLNGMADVYPDITKILDFDDAKSNFFAASRHGLDSKFTWINGMKISAGELLTKELIPIAREGLKKQKIKKKDIDRYMEMIEGRIETGQTGAQWAMSSFSKIVKDSSKDQALLAITAATLKLQAEETPVHKWPLATTADLEGSEFYAMSVEEFMNTDLFTVEPDDILDLVVEMMNSERLKYIPVEDKNGHMMGLVTSSKTLRHYRGSHLWEPDQTTPVRDIMIKNPITIGPNESISTALETMQKNSIGCLPVVEGTDLVGIITEQDFLKITLHLLNRLKKKSRGK